ncbi:transcriptional regulator [Candidatus Hepatincola sp. Av]
MKIHEIKYFLGCKGIRFSDIDKQFALRVGTARLAVSKPHKAGEEALAKILGISVKELFPARYDELGNRYNPQPAENYIYKTMQIEQDA